MLAGQNRATAFALSQRISTRNPRKINTGPLVFSFPLTTRPVQHTLTLPHNLHSKSDCVPSVRMHSGFIFLSLFLSLSHTLFLSSSDATISEDISFSLVHGCFCLSWGDNFSVSRAVTPPVSYEPKAPPVLVRATEFRIIRFSQRRRRQRRRRQRRRRRRWYRSFFQHQVESNVHPQSRRHSRVLPRYKLSGTVDVVLFLFFFFSFSSLSVPIANEHYRCSNV